MFGVPCTACWNKSSIETYVNVHCIDHLPFSHVELLNFVHSMQFEVPESDSQWSMLEPHGTKCVRVVRQLTGHNQCCVSTVVHSECFTFDQEASKFQQTLVAYSVSLNELLQLKNVGCCNKEWSTVLSLCSKGLLKINIVRSSWTCTFIYSTKLCILLLLPPFCHCRNAMQNHDTSAVSSVLAHSHYLLYIPRPEHSKVTCNMNSSRV